MTRSSYHLEKERNSILKKQNWAYYLVKFVLVLFNKVDIDLERVYSIDIKLIFELSCQ